MEHINKQAEDEIDLMNFVRIIWRRKYWIIVFVAVVCLATVYAVLKMDNIYESRAVLRPTQNNSSKVGSMMSNISGLASLAGVDVGGAATVTPTAVLNIISHDINFQTEFVTKHKFEKYLIDDYDKVANTQKFIDNRDYIISSAFNGGLQFAEDAKSGVINVAFQNKDRVFTKKLMDALLIDLSSRYQALEMHNIDLQINNYKEEMDKTPDITLKNKLSDLVAGLIQNKVVSQAQEYYGFDILVRPAVPDKMAKVKPRRSVICIAAFIISLIAGAGAAVIIDTMRKNKNT